MPMPPLNAIVNNTTADAVPVNDNYNVIRQYINGNVILSDGSVSMVNPLLLPGDPTQPLQAATKAYVDALFPVGIMMPYGGATTPAAGVWGLCNGQGLSTATYEDLFALIGYHYGGSGGTFNLPNMRGRVVIGFDDRDSGADARFDTIGESAGSFTLITPEHLHAMPHTHTMAHTHEHPHTHSIAHNHAADVTSNQHAAHQHQINTVSNGVAGTSNRLMRASAAGTTETSFLTDFEEAVHHHNYDVDAIAATSGQPNEATTAGPSAATTAGPSVSTTQATGTASAQHVPPYVVMSWIMRLI